MRPCNYLAKLGDASRTEPDPGCSGTAQSGTDRAPTVQWGPGGAIVPRPGSRPCETLLELSVKLCWNFPQAFAEPKPLRMYSAAQFRAVSKNDSAIAPCRRQSRADAPIRNRAQSSGQRRALFFSTSSVQRTAPSSLSRSGSVTGQRLGCERRGQAKDADVGHRLLGHALDFALPAQAVGLARKIAVQRRSVFTKATNPSKSLMEVKVHQELSPLRVSRTSA